MKWEDSLGECVVCHRTQHPVADNRMCWECWSDEQNKATVDFSNPSAVCGVCGKLLTPETNTEDCPGTLYWHGKHTAVVAGKATFGMMPLAIDPTMKPGTMELRDKYGAVLARIENIGLPNSTSQNRSQEDLPQNSENPIKSS